MRLLYAEILFLALVVLGCLILGSYLIDRGIQGDPTHLGTGSFIFLAGAFTFFLMVMLLKMVKAENYLVAHKIKPRWEVLNKEHAVLMNAPFWRRKLETFIDNCGSELAKEKAQEALTLFDSDIENRRMQYVREVREFNAHLPKGCRLSESTSLCWE